MRSEARVATTSWRDGDGVHTYTQAEARGDTPVEVAIAGEMAGKIGAAQSLAHSAGSLHQDSAALPGSNTSTRSLPSR